MKHVLTSLVVVAAFVQTATAQEFNPGCNWPFALDNFGKAWSIDKTCTQHEGTAKGETDKAQNRVKRGRADPEPVSRPGREGHCGRWGHGVDGRR